MMKMKGMYIGKGRYNPENFERECERLGGFSRKMPLWAAKYFFASFEEGEINALLFLFNWQYSGKVDEKVCRLGSCQMTGYGIVNGFNIPEEHSALLLPKLNVVKSSGGSGTVDRECGSYTISGSYIVNNTMKEMIDALEEVQNEIRKINPKATVSLFLTGKYHKLKSPIGLFNIKSSRTIIDVDVSNIKIEFPAQKEELIALNFIKDYKQIKYIRKKQPVKKSTAQVLDNFC